ncbi:MAG: 30S ribosomal protein S8 [Planctomycetota bacterium]
MTMTDPIADLLTRIRNQLRLNRRTALVPYSQLKQQLLGVLKREGFIEDFEVKKKDGGTQVDTQLLVKLKYGPDGERVISHIERISKPGCRVYRGIGDLNPVLRGMGIWVLSTPRGLLSDNEARVQKVGGEVLCKVY